MRSLDFSVVWAVITEAEIFSNVVVFIQGFTVCLVNTMLGYV